jgi:hypothetical protein
VSDGHSIEQRTVFFPAAGLCRPDGCQKRVTKSAFGRHDPVRATKKQSARNQSTPPDFLTVEEVADVLRIGRVTAYRLANGYIANPGPDLIPAEKYGKQIRVPRYKLEADMGGPMTWPPVRYEPDDADRVTPTTAPEPAPRATRRRAPRTEQTHLPFTE